MRRKYGINTICEPGNGASMLACAADTIDIVISGTVESGACIYMMTYGSHRPLNQTNHYGIKYHVVAENNKRKSASNMASARGDLVVIGIDEK